MSLEQSADKNLLKYNDLAEIVDSIDTLQFLQGKQQSCTYDMRCVMRKPDFCICENKGTEQLRSNPAS